MPPPILEAWPKDYCDVWTFELGQLRGVSLLSPRSRSWWNKKTGQQVKPVVWMSTDDFIAFCEDADEIGLHIAMPPNDKSH